MSRIRVAVLRGGPNNEFEVSLKTGAVVLKHIPTDIYEVQDIFISREGDWHRNGIQITANEVLSHVDVVFNALHGHYGEDGKVQQVLELHKVPFTGSASFASAVGMNKVLTKEIYKKENIKTPSYRVIESLNSLDLPALFRIFSPPVVVKPVSGGSSIGVEIVTSFPLFEPALVKALGNGSAVMIEEYIPGIEASVGVIEGYRDQELYVLPPIEIRPSEDIIPSTFSPQIKIELESLARKAHQALGLRHYSRTDFIVSPKRGIFVLETNTLPGLTEQSLLPKALQAVGSSLSHFFDHILQLAMGEKGK